MALWHVYPRVRPIDPLLYGGYSTISLGYAGLYECVKFMTGHSHTDPEATPFALAVMQRMNDKCTEWKQAENIDYSLYGTPLESTTYKFAKCLQRRFGVVPGITDQRLHHEQLPRERSRGDRRLRQSSNSRASSSASLLAEPSATSRSPTCRTTSRPLCSLLQFIYDNIMYAELNTKSDYCQECGYDGEIKIVEDDGKLVWECPQLRQPRPEQA